MSTVTPAFKAGNQNSATFAGVVAFDPAPLRAPSGTWTAFELTSADGSQPKLLLKAWRELASYVLAQVRAGTKVVARGQLEVSDHGVSLKTEFLEVIPDGVYFSDPTRALVQLSGTVVRSARPAPHDIRSVTCDLRVMTGKNSHFTLGVEGSEGRGGDRLALLREGDYLLLQGALRQRCTEYGLWTPVIETHGVMAACPFDLSQSPALQSAPATVSAPAPAVSMSRQPYHEVGPSNQPPRVTTKEGPVFGRAPGCLKAPEGTENMAGGPFEGMVSAAQKIVRCEGDFPLL